MCFIVYHRHKYWKKANVYEYSCTFSQAIQKTKKRFRDVKQLISLSFWYFIQANMTVNLEGKKIKFALSCAGFLQFSLHSYRHKPPKTTMTLFFCFVLHSDLSITYVFNHKSCRPATHQQLVRVCQTVACPVL